jgi:predicted TIM-barrel fold metal-dependent hydrolase
MMDEFPNLYADTSALNTPFRSAAFRKVLDHHLQDRFLHGSDFPVPIGTWYARLRGLIDSENRAKAARINNLIERDFFLKSAIGFKSNHFTGLNDVLRKI